MVTNTAPIEVGAIAPDFELISCDNKPVTLADYTGSKHLILYFMREFM